MRILSFALVVIVLTSCGGAKKGNAQNTSDENAVDIYEGLDKETVLKMKQYMFKGRELYLQRCSNCHQQDGSGLGKLIPPLAKSDYLLENLNASVCTIKYGRKGKIIVNGVEYDQPMPANTNLTNIQIAMITTYIRNSWGNKAGFFGVKEVQSILSSCSE